MLLEILKIEECSELKDMITGIGDPGGTNGGDVFPKLKKLLVIDCVQLKYIFGHYSRDHQNPKNISHLYLPALESLSLGNLSNFLGMCSDSYRTTLPPLTELDRKSVV